MRICRSDIACLSILLILQALLFPHAAFDPSNLLASKYSDVITQHLPHQVFIRQALLQNKRFPFWNPYECAGTPAFPNPLYLTLAFPHLLLVRLLPTLALSVGFFIHIFLAGALAYAFARKIGCAPPAALFAALVFSIGARPLSLIQGGIYPVIAYLPYIPLLFLCAERCASRPNRLTSMAMAICMTLALLVGEIQTLIYSALLVVVFTALRCRLASDENGMTASPPRALQSVLLGILLSLPLSAFYIIPAWLLYPLLTRSLPLGEAQFSMMPGLSSLRLLLNPWLLGDFSPSAELPWESSIYVGLAPLIVIASSRFKNSLRRDLHLWGLLAAATLLFSLREMKAIHQPLNILLPSLASFRNPGRMLLFFPFFAAMLAGKGLHALLRPHASNKCNHAIRSRLCLFLAALAVLYGAAAYVCLDGTDALARNHRLRFSGFFGTPQLGLLDANKPGEAASAFKTALLHSLVFQSAIVAALFLLFIFRERGLMPPRVFGILIVGIAYADLFYFGRPYLETHPIDEIYPASGLYKSIVQTTPASRLLDASAPPVAPFWTALPFFQSTALGISRVDGYTPVNLSSYARYMDLVRGGPETARPRWGVTLPSIKHPKLLSLLDAGFLLSESPTVGPPFILGEELRDVPVYRQFIGAGVIPHLFLYRNGDPARGAWLVPEAAACAPSEEDRLMLDLDFRRKALIQPGARGLSDGEPYRAVPISRPAPDLIYADLETQRPSYLCLSEVWTPGWRATDNGKPVDVVRIDKIFRGVYLDPGKHSLRMSYRPPGLVLGIAVSALTAAALIAAALRTRKRKEPRPKGAPSGEATEKTLRALRNRPKLIATTDGHG